MCFPDILSPVEIYTLAKLKVFGHALSQIGPREDISQQHSRGRDEALRDEQLEETTVLAPFPAGLAGQSWEYGCIYLIPTTTTASTLGHPLYYLREEDFSSKVDSKFQGSLANPEHHSNDQTKPQCFPQQFWAAPFLDT